MKLGLIGAGNMGQALLKGILDSQIMTAGHAYVYDVYTAAVERLQTQYPVHRAQSAVEVAQKADMVLLAVKPNVCAGVLKSCADALNGKALVSIVAGWSKDDIEALVPNTRILRVMPNTPCLVGEGAVVLALDHTLTEEEYAFAKSMFRSVGLVEEVPSYLMEAVTGLSGSGPAYVYMFVEALADAGVREGLPRDLAYRLASQTVLGAGKMVKETNMHPGVLKDQVCSPGGTTIEAVVTLEQGGFRAAVMDAVAACTDKARRMGEKK